MKFYFNLLFQNKVLLAYLLLFKLFKLLEKCTRRLFQSFISYKEQTPNLHKENIHVEAFSLCNKFFVYFNIPM